nr:hypothetical protein [Tanacetum cinerariifolium]
TAKVLARSLGSLDKVKVALPEVLTYLPDIGLEVAHEIHSFFEDDHNQNVIGALLGECEMQLQDTGDLAAEFAASATLGGMLDKLNIPSIGPGGAQKLADKFGTLEGVVKADWLDMRQTLPEKQAQSIRFSAKISGTAATPNDLVLAAPSGDRHVPPEQDHSGPFRPGKFRALGQDRDRQASTGRATHHVGPARYPEKHR